MSNVIFLSERTVAKQARPLALGETAAIIIFQGVRIERLTDDMIEQERSKPRRLPSLQNQATAEDLE